MAAEYVFIDEWEVEAPAEAVFEALADARTYPQWWRPVYLKVEADCPPRVGCVSRQEFKGRLPLPPQDDLRDRAAGPSARVRGQGRGRSHRARRVDAHPPRRSGAHPLRLASVGRSGA